MELHTAFELEAPELEERPLSGTGAVQVRLKSCEGGSGTNEVEEEMQWETLPESDGGGLIGIPTDPSGCPYLAQFLWDESVDDVAVELLVVDGNDVDFTHAFHIEPAETIGLGTILGRQQKTAAWLITPNQLNVTDPAGQDFKVSARVQYRWNGELREFTTRAHTINVFSSPELVIRYELPETSEDFLCQEFDLVATIQNVGNGPARNVR